MDDTGCTQPGHDRCKDLPYDMSRKAEWSGTPSIRGSTEPMRMILLSFSLIGLQYVSSDDLLILNTHSLQINMGPRVNLLHAVSPLPRTHKVANLSRLDRRTSVGLVYATCRGRNC